MMQFSNIASCAAMMFHSACLLCELMDASELSRCIHGYAKSRHIPVICFEWGKSGSCTHIAVECKLYHRAFLCPILLVIFDDCMEDLTDHSITPSICRWNDMDMRSLELSPHEPLEFTPEDGRELRVSIGHDGVWDSGQTRL